MADQSYTIEMRCQTLGCGATVTLRGITFPGDMTGRFVDAVCGKCRGRHRYVVQRPGEKPTPASTTTRTGWGQPEKLRGGDWIIGEVPPSGDGLAVILTPARELSNTRGHANPVPSEVVLRLLAAEASERLGWKWRVVCERDGNPCGCGCDTGPDYVRWWSLNEVQIDASLSPDELLATMHGRFLLADAIKATS